MSRILLNNGLLQRAASATPRTTKSTSTDATTFSHVVRRWKSLLHDNNATTTIVSDSGSGCGSGSAYISRKRLCTSTLAFSQSETVNAYARCAGRTTATDTPSQSKQQQQLQSQFVSRRDVHKVATMSKCLHVDNINPYFVVMEYAVRGPLVIRAGEIEQELKKGVKKPFNQVIRANIGDCHAMGQKPVTFLRQLLALTFEPRLLDSPDYPEDVKKRARDILNGCSGQSVGSYTDSAGLEVVRRQVANYIERRDGIPTDWHNIYLTGGASPGIKSIIALLRCHVDNKKAGIMVPIPQYPLYSATIAEYGMEKVDYYLQEEQNWSLGVKELERAYQECKSRCEPRGLVVINPGNPTGQVLKRENIVEIIKFAHEKKLVILADEVYQDNVYDKDSKFFSFKKVLHEMGAPYNDLELISFMSTSKGYLGECGIRGGYMEVLNMCPHVQATLTKSITASLCSTTAGQVAVSALVNPPQKGEPSYEQFIREKTATLSSLKERAELIYKTLNSFEGFKVNLVQGAMYAFPQITIPPKAIAAAKAKNMQPDVFYAFELLESTGICIVPGSGFGQKPGTYHFRTTILPQTEQLKLMMNIFQKFHAEFMKKYK